jgi:hypothetical protein
MYYIIQKNILIYFNLVYYLLLSGRLFINKASKTVGGPRGIVTPAWYLWRNRNEATISDDHIKYHNLSVRSIIIIFII